jgi:hypothetical protein
MHRFKIIAETAIYGAEEATSVTQAYICDAIRTPIGRFAAEFSARLGATVAHIAKRMLRSS